MGSFRFTFSRWMAGIAVLAATWFSLAPNMAPTSALYAQDTSPQNAATVNATEPVVVVTLGSIGKLMDDVNYLTGALGQAQAGGMFTMMVGTFTQGVDTTQPIGLLVPLVDGVPQPIALVPTPDVRVVLKRLEAQTGPADELDDGTLVIALGASTVFIRQSGNWAVLAPRRDLLDLAPANPMALFEGMGNAYDVAVRLRLQQVPAQMRSVLIAQMRQGFEQAMAQQGDADSAAEVAEGSMRQLEQLINDTDVLEFGINIDRTAKQVEFDASFTVVPGSDLAAVYRGQQSIPSQFASVIRDDAAAYYHACTSIGPEAVEQVRTNLSSSITAVKNALANENLSPKEQQDITEVIDRVVDLAIESVKEGRADVGALLLADQQDFRFVFGSFVADGNEAAQIVKDLAAKLDAEPDAPTFKFDQGTYQGVSLHVIEAKVPEHEDEVRKVFGDTLRVHLGTGPKSVYAAVGANSEALMKELIDSRNSDSGASRPISQMRLKLMPILEYVQSIEPNDTLAAMIDALARAPDPGEFKIVSDVIENGNETHVAIGEGLLQAIGAAARQAQQQQIQGGQF